MAKGRVPAKNLFINTTRKILIKHTAPLMLKSSKNEKVFLVVRTWIGIQAVQLVNIKIFRRSHLLQLTMGSFCLQGWEFEKQFHELECISQMPPNDIPSIVISKQRIPAIHLFLSSGILHFISEARVQKNDFHPKIFSAQEEEDLMLNSQGKM